ncbi:uncharacterized protein LOC112596261 [Melanaphis sacchari]|uniref:uncharacterized protein LOC112596261 n=1 Tax=Melanaphis sacchari TaxID=742174 RepID=UPI000DC15461|nr:uncharacterized protein LOC112596261 [Melanaphis sacchari]
MQTQPKNIIQWNLNGLHKNIDEIKLIINLHQPIAICLQKTNLKFDESPPNINNNQYATKNRRGCLRASGGVCTLINNSFPWEEIPLHTNIEAVAISIILETKTTLCNIYILNNFNFTLIDLENIIKQLPRPFIIVRDFNSHSHSWGSYKTDLTGKIIEKLLEQDNIVILNNKKQTRINPTNRNLSAIDLTFSTPTLAQRLHWQVLNEIYNSDHLPISIQFISNAYQMNHSTIKWNLKKPDWPLFSNLLEKKINSSEFTDDDIDIETTVSKFTKTVIETAEQTIGYIKPPSKKTPVPWWNNEIKQSISLKNKALKTFIKTRSLEDHIKLK